MVPPDIFETTAGPLTVQPIHHASLVLLFGDQAIYLDPVGPARRYDSLPSPTLILLTHEHGDHLDPANIDALATPRTRILGSQVALDNLGSRPAERIRQGETVNVAGIAITAIPAHNLSPERLKFHPEGVGNGYVLGFGDTRIYVAGDTEDVPEMLALTDIAAAFLPMNGYTMDGPQAAAAVKAFRPRVVYPFHYVHGAENESFARAMQGFPGVDVRQRDWYLPD